VIHVPGFVKHAAAVVAHHLHDEVAREVVRASTLHASRIAAKVAAALLFVVACAVLAVLRRRLAARARVEEAERVLKEEFTRLDDATQASGPSANSPRRKA